jgi:hypothetical protein
MPLYLTRFSYTPETWARLIAKPEDRREAEQVQYPRPPARLEASCRASRPANQCPAFRSCCQ